MNFIFVFAGIPIDFYDEVHSQHLLIIGDNAEFAGTPLFPKNGIFRYTQSYTQELIQDLHDRLQKVEEGNRMGNTAVCTVIVDHKSGTEAAVHDSFFPFALQGSVSYEPYRNRVGQKQTKNKMIRDLQQIAVRLRRGVPPIHDEVTSRANSTPILLPIRNFESGRLADMLRRLEVEILDSRDKNVLVARHRKEFGKHHPPKKPVMGKRKFYSDRRSIEFHPPGSARHGVPHRDSRHPNTCRLSAYARLGAPYDIAFHYDCTKGKKLHGEFSNCHEEIKYYEGGPHLNIAPNDFVR